MSHENQEKEPVHLEQLVSYAKDLFDHQEYFIEESGQISGYGTWSAAEDTIIDFGLKTWQDFLNLLAQTQLTLSDIAKSSNMEQFLGNIKDWDKFGLLAMYSIIDIELQNKFPETVTESDRRWEKYNN